MSEKEERRMSGYYISFSKTGCDHVDKILSSVAHAGKGYHSTEGWSEPVDDWKDYNGGSYETWIQNSANEAAAEITRLTAQLTEKEALLKEAVKVIEFYGNQNNYDYFKEYKIAEYWNVLKEDWDFGNIEAPEYNENKAPLVFGGRRAREFLAKLKAGR